MIKGDLILRVFSSSKQNNWASERELRTCKSRLMFYLFNILPEVWELVDDVLPVVPLGDHGVVEEGDELQLAEAGQRLQVGQLLQHRRRG